MTISGTRARAALLVGAIVLAAWSGRAISVPAIAGDQKGDEATYITMALSAADDGNLRYERSDFVRYREIYTHGPEGIFLKRAYALGRDGWVKVSEKEYVAFAKPFIYPLAAAPFVAIGGLGGMLVFNVLLVAVCVWCAVRFCQAQMGRVAGLVLGASFVLASDIAIFSVWLTPEVFNFSLVFVAYFLWLYKKVAPAERLRILGRPWTDLAAALLLGVATYSKPTHLLLVAPLAIDLLFLRRWSRLASIVAVFAVASVGLFMANAVVTGEWNYQGATEPGDRRSFYGRFPFDDKGTVFEGTGSAMATSDSGLLDLIEPALEFLPINLWYFAVGRHAGLVPYYFPGVLIALVWLMRARRAPLWQWTTALSFPCAVLALLVLTPDTWNGAGGPPGSRYIASSYGVLLFLVPAGLGLWSGVVAALGSFVFIGHMLVHPFAASARPWLNVERAPLRWLPIELSIINDLPVRLEPRRGPIRFITEPVAVYFYYLDGNTYSVEMGGFWIAGDAGTDIIVRTDKPIARATFVFSSPIANHVTATLSGREASAEVVAGGEATVALTPPSYSIYRAANAAGIYEDSYAYVLHLTTTHGFVPATREPGSADTRNLGVFVKPSFVFR